MPTLLIIIIESGDESTHSVLRGLGWKFKCLYWIGPGWYAPYSHQDHPSIKSIQYLRIPAIHSAKTTKNQTPWYVLLDYFTDFDALVYLRTHCSDGLRQIRVVVSLSRKIPIFFVCYLANCGRKQKTELWPFVLLVHPTVLCHELIVNLFHRLISKRGVHLFRYSLIRTTHFLTKLPRAYNCFGDPVGTPAYKN